MGVWATILAKLTSIIDTIATMIRDQRIEDGGRAKQKNEQQEKQDENARKVNAGRNDDDLRQRVRDKFQRKNKLNK